jgi:hypothetical protein
VDLARIGRRSGQELKECAFSAASESDKSHTHAT